MPPRAPPCILAVTAVIFKFFDSLNSRPPDGSFFDSLNPHPFSRENSPFRPNSLGLSSVKLLGVEHTAQFGTVLHVGGADLMDGTPIFDIKPYIPYGDCHTDATGGFTDTAGEFLLRVVFPQPLLDILPEDKREAAIGVLRHDPRPSYQRKPDRVYGLTFAGYDIRFTVSEDILTVVEVTPRH